MPDSSRHGSPSRALPSSAGGEPEFQDHHFAILQDAVNIARHRNIRKVETLKSILVNMGNDTADVLIALRLWSDYEKAKASPLPTPSAN